MFCFENKAINENIGLKELCDQSKIVKIVNSVIFEAKSRYYEVTRVR